MVACPSPRLGRSAAAQLKATGVALTGAGAGMSAGIVGGVSVGAEVGAEVGSSVRLGRLTHGVHAECILRLAVANGVGPFPCNRGTGFQIIRWGRKANQ